MPDEELTELTDKDSILITIKKKLGVDKDDHGFDDAIISDINSVIFTLNQIGIGEDDFEVENETTTWADLLGNKVKILKSVSTFMYLNVKLTFDTPSSSFVIASMEKQIEKLEWRLNVAVESLKEQNDGQDEETEP